MSFSQNTIDSAWNKAGGRCEGCRKGLRYGSKGVESPVGWEAHHIHSVSAGGHDGLSNCKILCKKCHQNTSSYGG